MRFIGQFFGRRIVGLVIAEFKIITCGFSDSSGVKYLINSRPWRRYKSETAAIGDTGSLKVKILPSTVSFILAFARPEFFADRPAHRGPRGRKMFRFSKQQRMLH